MINSYAYAEVLEILENMNQISINKIPPKLLDKIRKNASATYKRHINPSIDLKKQNISKEALSMLATINLKYWVENEYQRKRLLNIYKKNDNKKGEKLPQISLNNIFKQNQIKVEKKSENIMPIVKKETLGNKIINFFKTKFFM